MPCPVNSVPRALLPVLVFLLVVGCGSSTPTDPQDEGGTGPVANPDGVLLDGEASSPARDSMAELAPSPAPPLAELLDTRLVALVAANASVGAVNAELDAIGARVVAMQPGSPFVTLKIPAVPDPAAAQALADGLVGSGAFDWVSPARPARTGVVELQEAQRAASARRTAAADHLALTRMLRAWNVADLGLANQDRIAVLMPDEYASSATHAEIDAQRIVGFGSPNSLPGPQVYPGNLGFVLAGLVGANVDETPPTGTSPYPTELLDIRSMPVGGLTWYDIIWMLAWQIASAGDEFVVHSGLEFNDPDFEVVPALDRAMQALAWRVAAVTHQSKFVMVIPTPSASESIPSASPFRIAAAYPDLRDFMEDAEAPEEDVAIFEAAWLDLASSFPQAVEPLTNTITVGARFLPGPVPDVRAPGTELVAPCVFSDPAGAANFLCDGDVGVYTGHSLASAQVAGLAAYMMGLTDASVGRIRDVILGSTTDGGVIDAFTAVMALDTPTDLLVHEALLDVAGFESEDEDGRFDQWDLEAIAEGPPVFRAPQDVVDSAMRFDFNGDGRLDAQATARVDLDLDGQFGTISSQIEAQNVTFDENAVRDIDVACFYAYSPAYSGDPTVRGEYLLADHTGLQVELLDLPARIAVPSTFDVRIRVGLRGEDGTLSYVAGVETRLEINSGDAEPRRGTTDESGIVTTTVTIFEDDYNQIEFEASAQQDDEFAEVIVSVLRENEIRLLERRSTVLAGVFATYAEDVGVPSVRYIDEFEMFETTDFEAFDATASKQASGSGAGITVSGNASARGTSRVELVGDDELRAFYVTSQQSTALTLSDPNFSLRSYQANSYATIEHVIDFVVFGEPATFTMHGSTGAEEYDIELDGESGFEVCDSDDEPCNTISTGGELLPGDYSLSVDHGSRLMIRWYDGCTTDCNPTSGSLSSQGSLDLDFEVYHEN